MTHLPDPGAAWLRVALFDFDGVIVNSEPFHCAATIAVMSELGMPLSEETYYREPIGFDDRGGFAHLFAMNQKLIDPETSRAVIAAKNRQVLAMVSAGPVRPLPGAIEFIRALGKEGCLLAICSGALRSEIEAMLEIIGLSDAFSVIVAGGEVPVGKPNPSGYVRAIALLNERHGAAFQPGDTLVIEDAPRVAAAVRAIGFPVLGVTTSYASERWSSYDWLAASLTREDLSTAGVPFNASGSQHRSHQQRDAAETEKSASD